MWYKLRMAAKIVRVEGYDGAYVARNVLPSHSQGHRIFREVPEKEAELVALRWAASHPPERVRIGEPEPYLMIVSKRGERLARWRAKDGSWHKA